MSSDEFVAELWSIANQVPMLQHPWFQGILRQFLEEGGISREEADQADPAPGTMAAIEMIVGCCQRRSALEGLAMLSFVESQHGGPNGVAAQVYRELVGFYG